LVFGIPHNYFFSSLSRQPNKVDIQNILINRKPLYERRASPLFIHVHPIGEKFTALQFVLQSQFLPRDALVRVKAGSTPKDLPYEPDWEVLDDYIDGKYQTHDRD
jgi:CRISPR-associated protein Cmr1